MSNVVNRTTLEYRTSVSTPDYSDPPWLEVPPGSANETICLTVPQKYRKISGDTVSEMSAGEKATVDAAEAAADTTARHTRIKAAIDSKGAGNSTELRALLNNLNKRINYAINRITEIQAELEAAKATSGGADNIRNALIASHLATNTRTMAQAVTDLKSDVDAGEAD